MVFVAITIMAWLGGCGTDKNDSVPGELDNREAVQIDEYELKEDVSVHALEGDAIQESLLTDINGSTHHVVTLKEQTPNIQINHFVSMKPSKFFPYGFIGQVKQITQANGHKVLLLEKKGLADIFKKLKLHIKKDLFPSRIQEGFGAEGYPSDPNTLYVLRKAEGVSIDIGEDFTKNGVEGNPLKSISVTLLNVTADGNLSIDGAYHCSPSVNMNISIGHTWDFKPYIDNNTYLSEGVTVWGNLKATGKGSISITVPVSIAELILGTVDLEIGPVPVTIVFRLNLDLVTKGFASGDFVTNFRYHVKSEETIGKWNDTWSASGEPEELQLDNIESSFNLTTASEGFKIGVRGTIGAYIESVLGPWASIYPYNAIQFTPDSKINDYIGIAGTVSFGLRAFGIIFASVNRTLFDKKTLIYSDK